MWPRLLSSRDKRRWWKLAVISPRKTRLPSVKVYRSAPELSEVMIRVKLSPSHLVHKRHLL